MVVVDLDPEDTFSDQCIMKRNMLWRLRSLMYDRKLSPCPFTRLDPSLMPLLEAWIKQVTPKTYALAAGSLEDELSYVQLSCYHLIIGEVKELVIIIQNSKRPPRGED